MNSPIQKSKTPTIQPSANFWLTEPATNVDPRLAKSRPSFAYQYIYYHGVTGQALGMTRRLLHEGYLTAWFSCGKVVRKRHCSVHSAKQFIERQFTRTVPRRTEFAPSTPLAPMLIGFEGSRITQLARRSSQRRRPSEY